MPEWSNFSSICKLRGSGSVQTSTGRYQKHNFADLQLLPSFDNFGLNMNSLWRHLLYHLLFRSAHTLCADLETKKAFVATLKIFESFCRNSENISKHWNVFVATQKICRKKWLRPNNEGLRILFCKKVQSGNERWYN